jgi:uncharacterized membrane protein YgaE (UPF0421/DUF939 family)
MTTITNKDKRSFKNILMSIVNTISDESERLSNNSYLNINNDLKQLYDLINNLSNNQVYRTIVRNERYGVDVNRRDKTPLSIMLGIHAVCNKCGRVVLSNDLQDHKSRPICKDIIEERNLSLHTRTLKTKKKFLIDNSIRTIQKFYRNKVKK